MIPAPDRSVYRAALADPKPRPEQVESLLKTAPAVRWSKPDGYAETDKRSGGRCEHPSGCTQPATVHHHIAGRKGPDPHRPDNLLHLCDPHHRWVHAHPTESYRNGTMRKRNGRSS